jgi:NAD(P)-dependent dehydrogenase (short-subunit alcohol dehydrogenase family)
MMKFDGKVVMMTGADGGIGTALSKTLYDAGATLILHGQELPRLESLAKAGAWDEARYSLDAHDVTDAGAVRAAVDKALTRFGKIDALINMAGINRFGGVLHCSEEEWDAVMTTNVKGYFLTTQAVAPAMKTAGQGQILNISSIWGIRGNARMMAYSTSKHAVEGFTASLRAEVAPWGVKVSSLIVGIVDNNFRAGMGGQVVFTPEQCARMLESEDVVEAIVYVLGASPKALPSSLTLEAWLLQ